MIHLDLQMAEQDGAITVDATTPAGIATAVKEEARDASATVQPTQMTVGTMAGTTGSTGLTSNEQVQPPAKFKLVTLDSQARVVVMTMPQGRICYRCGSWCPYPFPRAKCGFCGESPSWHCQYCCPVYRKKGARGSDMS